jgi:adenine phosphoribosyltransferase
MIATATLIRRLGGVVEHAGFIISLPDIGGKAKLKAANITPYCICEFDGD